MPFSLLPTFMTPKLTDITAEKLQRHRIQLLMLDFDNTIVPYTTSQPTPEMEAWLRNMVQGESSICVGSSSHNARAKILYER